jgi:SAM-dependent methyltransferase
LDRIPEPELMEEAEQALAYAREDFSEPNALFVERFAELAGGDFRGRILDLGCGPADIVLRLARAFPRARIDGVDGSEPMLAFGREALAAAPRLGERVRLIRATLPCGELEASAYDAVVSNSLLHHLHRPQVLWETVRQCARPGAAVAVMDLVRPPSAQEADAILAAYAAGAPDVLRRDFRNSLFAAFTVDEVRTQLEAAGLGGLGVERPSDRHLLVRGRLA